MTIEPIGPRAHPSGGRSQAAVEVLLNFYAIACAIILARAVLQIASVDQRVWIGAFVFRFTDPIVAPLRLLPGADNRFIGNFGMPDATLIAIAVLTPLGFIALKGHS